jgi:hypothetical protein
VSLPGEVGGYLRISFRCVFVGGFGSGGLNDNNNNDDNRNENNGLSALRKFSQLIPLDGVVTQCLTGGELHPAAEHLTNFLENFLDL